MKVLFVHDGPMMINKSKTSFFGVHYTDEIINRYSYFGSIVTFLMRSAILPNNQSNKYTYITHSSFRFIEVPNFKSIRTKIKQKKAYLIIKKAVESHDIIIVRLPSANGVLAKKIADQLGKPILVEVVACVFDALWNYDYRGKLLAYYKYIIYKKLIKKSDFVIYVTDEFLQNRYPTEGKSVGISDVELNMHDDLVLNKRLEKINAICNKITMGTIASLDVPYKGQSNVIKAIHNLKKIGFKNFFYKIVGQGNPQKLQDLIDKLDLNNEVEIIGAIPHSQIFDYLDSLDLYIQPSKVEGMPRSVIEAMSRACPIIASNVGGHPELIDRVCLFNSSSVLEIENKLKSITLKNLKEWSLKNFEKSKNFSFELLNSRRASFYSDFEKFASKKVFNTYK